MKIARRLPWLLLVIGCVYPLVADADVDLVIRGAPDAVEENIRLHLSKWKELPSDNVDAVRGKMQPAVTEALRALGYYQAEVDYALRNGELVLTVEPGPRMQWGEVDIQVLSNGEPVDGGFNTLVADNPFTAQQEFSHRVYEDYKSRLLSFANNRGYLDTQLTRSRLRLRVQEQRADVILHAEVGERYTIAEAAFGDSRLAPALVKNIAEVPVGGWYSANIVGDIYNRLLNSGYFAGVTVNVDKVAPDQAYLRIYLEDLPQHIVATGIGFGTDTGPWIKLRWERPAINQRGHSLNAELQLSQISQEVFTQYKIPWGHPQNEFVSWDTGWRHKETEDRVETEVLTTGLSYNRVLGETWRYSLHMDLENETSQQGSGEEETTSYLIPSARISRRYFSGDATDPDSGYHYWLHLAASSDSFGSDTDFQRLYTGLNTLLTFRERHSLLGRLEYGLIIADNLPDVPLSQRFFTGGDQTVRGYAFESIAPRDADGNLTGGERLNVLSAEYRYRFRPSWEAAVFVDTGRAFLEDDAVFFDNAGRPIQDTGDDFRTGAGVGIRWKSPVGFIAFDIATPVNDDRESGIQLHLYLGTPL
jgi:translocation and assembly module TamA